MDRLEPLNQATQLSLALCFDRQVVAVWTLANEADVHWIVLVLLVAPDVKNKGTDNAMAAGRCKIAPFDLKIDFRYIT